MRRIVLFFVVTALMAAMVAVSALTGAAQDTGGQYKGEAPAVDESGQPGEVLYCAPEWLREWHQAESWWYFWWYKWCHNDEDEWFKLYANWEWWGPVEEQ